MSNKKEKKIYFTIRPKEKKRAFHLYSLNNFQTKKVCILCKKYILIFKTKIK